MFCFNTTAVLEQSILRTSNGAHTSSRPCVLHFDPGFISSPCYTLVPYSAQTPDGRKVFESVLLLCRSPPARGPQTLAPSVEKVFNAVLSQEQQVHLLSDDSKWRAVGEPTCGRRNTMINRDLLTSELITMTNTKVRSTNDHIGPLVHLVTTLMSGL